VDLGLTNKTAIVTGGAKGIGEAICRVLAEEGASVVIVDRDGKAARSLADQLGRSAQAVVADLTDVSACFHAAELAGPIDVLVNNAGVNDGVDLEAGPAAFRASLELNLVHYYTMAHACRRGLIERRGAIVNLGSKVALTGQGQTSGYAAAKGAVLALTREWAAALAPHGVRVNAVLPAETITPMYQNWFDQQPDPAAARQNVERLVPLGRRMTTPREIADTVVFLASERSTHTTGQILCVDGGYTHLDRASTESGATWSKS